MFNTAHMFQKISLCKFCVISKTVTHLVPVSKHVYKKSNAQCSHQNGEDGKKMLTMFHSRELGVKLVTEILISQASMNM